MQQQPPTANLQAAYGNQAILTASPSAQIVKLYEGAIMNLRKAVRCIDEGDIEGRWRANRKAFDIIEHLRLVLNIEKGGEIASNLDQLYGHMMLRLFDVDVKNDRAAAEEVIMLLEPLHKSWCELDRRLASNASSKTEQSNEGSTDTGKAVSGGLVATA